MLTERQLSILQAIVDDYIQTAEPVGSRSISKREDITFSSATIRNDMADLEELGFFWKSRTAPLVEYLPIRAIAIMSIIC